MRPPPVRGAAGVRRAGAVIAHPRPMPTAADLEAARDRARTERLLEQTADHDLEQHRHRQAAGPLATITGRIARGAW